MGITFYHESKAPQVNETIELLKKRFGEGYMVTESRRQKGFVYIARAPLNEFDSEGDPRNLCKQPRTHEFLSAIKIAEAKNLVIDYILVANIKNLCAFGDAFLSKLFKKELPGP